MKKIYLCGGIITCLALAITFLLPVFATNKIEVSDEILADLISSKIEIAVPGSIKQKPTLSVDKSPLNTGVTTTTKVREINGKKVVYYKILVWGNVVADVNDFRAKVAETLNDARGWVRANLKFVEVQAGADVDVILSDPDHLEALNGCSGTLSCTTFANQVIINDVRWREGTEASRAAGMGQRDYQHMVVNHEMGHWLGHYQHVESCPNGGPAPIMLQQSTGMRGCESFNAWPLDQELWTDK